MDDTHQEGVPRDVMLFIVVTVTLGAVAQLPLAFGAAPFTDVSWVGLVLFVGLIVIAELLSADIGGRSTISVSSIAMLAAGFLYGAPGIVVTSVAFAVAGKIDSHSPLHRVMFNVGNMLLSTGCAVWIVWWLTDPFTAGDSLNRLLLPSALAGMVFYVVHIALLCLVRGLAERRHPLQIWRSDFQWLWVPYAVMGALSIFLAVVYITFGWAGVIAATAPAVMVQVAMRQHVSQEVARAEAERSREEAIRASEAKSAFLSQMSHELRTPLNSILGFAQVLEMEATSDEQLESLGYISSAGNHLLALINEVLDLARIEAGRLVFAPEPVAVGQVLNEVVALAEPLAVRRGIVVRIDAASEEDVFVLADRQRLTQVLLNLVSNAVKYNREDGSVAITIAAGASERLRISVRDTGIGIAPAALGRLFAPFERLGAEHTEIEGSGLGLALSKQLVEAMGGQLGVESVLGEGSTFWVDLPAVVTPGESCDPSEPSVSSP